MRPSPLLSLLALTLSVTVGHPAAIGAQPLPSRAIVEHAADSIVRRVLASNGSPSLAVAIVRGGDTLVMKAWGTADLESPSVATAQTVYRIGSVTKQFTAAVVLQLVDSGSIRIDDAIGTYLPTLPAAWKPVTIRQLLNHTSGIPSYTDIGAAWARRWGEQMTPDTLIALSANTPMWFTPGTQWRYDNTGYVVLGMLIEQRTGMAWGDVIAQRFAKPLGLAHTTNCLPSPLVLHRARGYEREGNAWENTAYLDMSQPYAAGALCSTIGDLATWNHALHSGRVISPASYRLMTTPEGAAATGALKYGFGLGRDTLAGRDVITHGGAIHGFRSANVWIPSAKLSITVLANSGNANPDAVMQKLARVALGVSASTSTSKAH